MSKRKKNNHDVVSKNLSKGWYCPPSPDHSCYYFSELNTDRTARVVRLADGKTHALPAYYRHQEENSDECIFCGLPEERK